MTAGSCDSKEPISAQDGGYLIGGLAWNARLTWVCLIN